MKLRIKKLEQIMRNKLKPLLANIRVNYENQMSKEEKEELINQGVKIIDVVYV